MRIIPKKTKVKVEFYRNFTLTDIIIVLIGFGMLFIGIDLISDTIKVFKNYEFFCNMFLVENMNYTSHQFGRAKGICPIHFFSLNHPGE